MYVQHKIKENGPFLADLILNKEACICVSGRAKFMPKSVEKAFAAILAQLTGNDGEGDTSVADYIS